MAAPTQAASISGECAICQETLAEGTVDPMICHHLFHRACITPWIAEHRTCPLCRTTIVFGPEPAPLQLPGRVRVIHISQHELRAMAEAVSRAVVAARHS